MGVPCWGVWRFTYSVYISYLLFLRSTRVHSKNRGGTPVGLKEKLYTFVNERKKEPLHEYATVLGAKYGVLWHGYMEINTAFGV